MTKKMRTMEESSPEQQAKRKYAARMVARYKADFELFAKDNLKIIHKNPASAEEALAPFVLNPAQKMIHEALEKQRAETGKVRAIILKSRRQGSSSYILGRYYWQASLARYKAVAIVAHISKTVGSLYRAVKRFHEHNPLAPSVGNSNIRELVFDKLDSRYSVFSAETGEGGRGEDVTHLHLSEAAFYSDLQAQMRGIVEAVTDAPGTEIIFECTANKHTGVFYDFCIKALKGESPYILIFVPFSVSPEYSEPVPKDFVPETIPEKEGYPSETELIEHFGLTHAQLQWRRTKIAGSDLASFTREYPLSVEQAFMANDEGCFIDQASVTRARKRKGVTPGGSRILGVDPASGGGDRFAIASRRGNVIEWVQHRRKVKPTEGAAWIKSLIDQYSPDRVFIDYGGGGEAIASFLKEMGPQYRDIIKVINFGSKSQHKMAKPHIPGPRDRRAEIWGRLKEWLEDEDALVSIPDETDLQIDIAAAQRRDMANGDWRLVPKDQIKEASTDMGDACALTFADLRWMKTQKIEVSDSAVEVPIKKPYNPVIRKPRGGSWLG